MALLALAIAGLRNALRQGKATTEDIAHGAQTHCVDPLNPIAPPSPSCQKTALDNQGQKILDVVQKKASTEHLETP